MLTAPPEALLFAALVALVVDALAGEPRWLYRRLPHPVVAIGRLVGALEGRLWQPGQSSVLRCRRGAQLVTLTLTASLVVSLPFACLLWQGTVATVITGLAAGTLLAQRSLVDHVRAVAQGLDEDVETGRTAVAQIVGRDPQSLDASGVARAAIESAAENLSDGVVAPLCWLLLLGPLGLVGYKAINTMDSMVGYRSERYLAFGRTAARLDDRVNWLPARLTALLLLLVAGRLDARARLPREARKHRSPNAGWPEAAMAVALDVRLAGPRVYASGTVDDDWIGDGRAELGASDIRRAVGLLWRVWTVLALLVGGSAIAIALLVG